MAARLPVSTILEQGPGGSAVSLSVAPGGLRVVTETMPAARSASIGVWVGVGSADEAPQLAGASHYLEHLLFKGTRRRSAAQIASAIDRVGGELNAFTAHEYTCYYAHVLAEDAALAVDIVSDVVRDATIAADDVETERSVILDEIAMRDDDPADALAEVFASRLFRGHPVGDPVSGSAASVAALSRQQIRGYYRRRYDPRAMVVAVAGGVQHRDVLQWVGEAFGDAAAGEVVPRAPRRGPGYADPGPAMAVSTRDLEQAHLSVGVPALPRHHPDRFALAVLSTAVGGGMSSRLFRTIREEHGLAYTCYSGISAYADAGALSLYAACHPANLSDVAELIGRVCASVAADGLTDDEIDIAKGQLCGATVLGLEDTEARMHRIGRRLLTRPDYLCLDEELAAIRAVTSEQVTAIARRLLGRPGTVATAGPYRRLRDLPPAVRALARQPLTAP